jgi:ribosomal protein S27AE
LERERPLRAFLYGERYALRDKARLMNRPRRVCAKCSRKSVFEVKRRRILIVNALYARFILIARATGKERLQHAGGRKAGRERYDLRDKSRRMNRPRRVCAKCSSMSFFEVKRRRILIVNALCACFIREVLPPPQRPASS